MSFNDLFSKEAAIKKAAEAKDKEPAAAKPATGDGAKGRPGKQDANG